jgi:hypothetical protein
VCRVYTACCTQSKSGRVSASFGFSMIVTGVRGPSPISDVQLFFEGGVGWKPRAEIVDVFCFLSSLVDTHTEAWSAVPCEAARATSRTGGKRDADAAREADEILDHHECDRLVQRRGGEAEHGEQQEY